MSINQQYFGTKLTTFQHKINNFLRHNEQFFTNKLANLWTELKTFAINTFLVKINNFQRQKQFSWTKLTTFQDKIKILLE